MSYFTSPLVNNGFRRKGIKTPRERLLAWQENPTLPKTVTKPVPSEKTVAPNKVRDVFSMSAERVQARILEIERKFVEDPRALHELWDEYIKLRRI